MLINIQNLYFNVLYKNDDIDNKIPLIFLHGFTGSVNDWEFIAGRIHENFTPIFIDLIGHGDSSSPIEKEHYTFASQVQQISDIAKILSIKKFVLAGYSMGGRLALLYSIKFPSKIIGLILESTSFGIEDSEERELRLRSDRELSKKIESDGVENFIDFWLSLPLFDSLGNLPLERYNLIRDKKIRNNSIGLKNTLLEFSTGKMNYLIPEILKTKFKILLIAGDLDTKFKVLSKEALEQIPNSNLKIVQNSGHNVHFEKPEVFLKLINEFLSNIEEIDGNQLEKS